MISFIKIMTTLYIEKYWKKYFKTYDIKMPRNIFQNYLSVIFVVIIDQIEKNLNIFTDVDTPVSGKLS